MAENILDWNATNWATVILMVVVGFLVFGVIVNLYEKYTNKGS
jgi:hypothetical protein